MNSLKNNHGVTLIELVITIGLIGIVITPISAFFLFSMHTYNRQQDSIALSMASDVVIQQIFNESKYFKSIYAINGTRLEDNSIEMTEIIFLGRNNGQNSYTWIDDQLLYDNDVIGENIISLVVEVVPDDVAIQSAKGVKFFMTFRHENVMQKELLIIRFRQ